MEEQVPDIVRVVPEATPPLSAILRSLAERLTALEDAVNARGAPKGEIRQALDDILAIYGTTAQTGEVIRQQRDQIQTLIKTMEAFHDRLIEHDQRASDAQQTIRELMEQLRAHQIGLRAAA